MRIWLAVSLLVLSIVVASGCSFQTPSSKDQPSAQPTPVQEAFVSATGRVLPVWRASLSFNMSGLVKRVLVGEGQEVAAGEVLATLDVPELQVAVEQAEAALQVARAQVVQLEAGARAEEIRSAEVAVSMARDGVAASDLAAVVAQANVAASEAALDVAQASLDQVKAGPTADELEVARQRVEQAKALRYAAQGQRDAVGGMRGRPGYQGGSYESTEGQVMAQETAVTIAELSRHILADGARPESIAVAEAQVRQAEAAVGVARAQERTTRQQVSISQRKVQQAQAQLDLVRAPLRDEDLKVARAGVIQAEAAVRAARVVLEKCFLRAPFAGTVTEVKLRRAEHVMMGVPQITLGELSSLRVETTDLDEIDVARVAVGRKVALTFDALPDLQLSGTVQRIALMASAGAGGTTYKVIITFDELAPRLRWGMTAFADIETE